jgi:hypothetical protein
VGKIYKKYDKYQKNNGSPTVVESWEKTHYWLSKRLDSQNVF